MAPQTDAHTRCSWCECLIFNYPLAFVMVIFH